MAPPSEKSFPISSPVEVQEVVWETRYAIPPIPKEAPEIRRVEKRISRPPILPSLFLRMNKRIRRLTVEEMEEERARPRKLNGETSRRLTRI